MPNEVLKSENESPIIPLTPTITTLPLTKTELSNVPPRFRELEQFICQLQIEIHKINPLYQLKVSHASGTNGMIEQSQVNLVYQNEVLFKADTQVAYLRYDGSNAYKEENVKSYFSRHARLEETVSFHVYAWRYFEVLGDKIKSAVAKHELALASVSMSPKDKTPNTAASSMGIHKP